MWKCWRCPSLTVSFVWFWCASALTVDIVYLCASISIRLNVSDIANELFRMCTLHCHLYCVNGALRQMALQMPCTVHSVCTLCVCEVDVWITHCGCFLAPLCDGYMFVITDWLPPDKCEGMSLSCVRFYMYSCVLFCSIPYHFSIVANSYVTIYLLFYENTVW